MTGVQTCALPILEVHEEGVVDKIKFMYVLENEHVDEGIAKRLLEKLVGLDKVGQGEQEEARGEKKLREFREIVRELKRLDEMTEETTMDCFAITSKMAESIVAVLEGERYALALVSPYERKQADSSSLASSHNLEPSSHGIYLSQPLHSHTSILYYASPSRLLSPEWSSAVTDNFSVDSSAELHDTEGVYSLDINLEKPGSTGALDYLGASTSTQPECVLPVLRQDEAYTCISQLCLSSRPLLPSPSLPDRPLASLCPHLSFYLTNIPRQASSTCSHHQSNREADHGRARPFGFRSGASCDRRSSRRCGRGDDVVRGPAGASFSARRMVRR